MQYQWIQNMYSRQTYYQMKDHKNESVKVALRVRPLIKREEDLQSPLCVETRDNVLTMRKEAEAREFVFDYVFGIQTEQLHLYETCAFTIVENALEGFNGTMFAYGQTGAGKTYTMMGESTDSHLKGIIPRGFEHVITAIQTSETRQYIIRASFLEIYNENIYDLLSEKSKSKKELRQNPQTGVFIKNLKLVPVKSTEEMFKLLEHGKKIRTVAQTKMNDTSSRSHALFTLHIESIQGTDKIKASKLNFVDLAGSERQGKTGATGETLKQGAKINLSLTALGNVINALVDGKKGGHIPYRDSKLTRLLQDSLGGNTKTLMLATVSPALDNYDETVSTLRYAARARNIKNTPKINEDPKDALIREYLAEIENLKKQLGGVEGHETSQELYEELEKARKKEKELDEKEAELLTMKARMKQMEELIMKKENSSPQLLERAKKRRLQKKKILKNEELNENRLHQLEEEEARDIQDEPDDGKDINYWKSKARKLKKKLKSAIQDRKDLSQEFEEQRERLNECIRNLEGNLSFYTQIAEKFLSISDIAALKDVSVFNFEKRQYKVPPFLLHDDKLTLPKTLKKHQVEDLWENRRKGHKLKFLTPDLPNLEQPTLVPEMNKTAVILNRNQGESHVHPFIQNRRIFRVIDPNHEHYKEKQYTGEEERQTFFRRTTYLMRKISNSPSPSNRSPSASFRVLSRPGKLQPIRSKSKDPTSREKSPGASRGLKKIEVLPSK